MGRPLGLNRLLGLRKAVTLVFKICMNVITVNSNVTYSIPIKYKKILKKKLQTKEIVLITYCHN